MRVIIAGGRDFNNYVLLLETIIKSNFDITEIVSGGAAGADRLGEKFAYEANISLKRFPANWNIHGRKAGIIRNGQMAEYADALIAVWDNKSPGTANMIKQAQSKRLKIFVEYY